MTSQLIDPDIGALIVLREQFSSFVAVCAAIVRFATSSQPTGSSPYIYHHLFESQYSSIFFFCATDGSQSKPPHACSKLTFSLAASSPTVCVVPFQNYVHGRYLTHKLSLLHYPVFRAACSKARRFGQSNPPSNQPSYCNLRVTQFSVACVQLTLTNSGQQWRKQWRKHSRSHLGLAPHLSHHAGLTGMFLSTYGPCLSHNF